MVMLKVVINKFVIVAGQKFEFSPVIVLSADCVEIEDIQVISYGDILFLVDINELKNM